MVEMPERRSVRNGAMHYVASNQWRIKRSGDPGARYSVGPSAPLKSPCKDETPESYYILDLI